MTRYISIYKTLLKINLEALFIYRGAFVNSAISSITWSVFSVVSIFLLTSHSKIIYGLTQGEWLVFVGLFNIVMGINRTVFSKNFDRFAEIVHLGELDSILLKPCDSQFLLSCWYFNYTGLTRVILGIIFTTIVMISLHVQINLLSIVLFLGLSLFSLSIFYSLSYIVITFTIWYPRLSNLSDFLYSALGISRYPKIMFQELQGYIFFLVLPITLTVTVPVQYIFHKVSTIDTLLLIGFGTGFLLISHVFWKFALRFYTSASG